MSILQAIFQHLDPNKVMNTIQNIIAPQQNNSPSQGSQPAAQPQPKPKATGTPQWLQYANSGATRNKPISPKLVDAMSFLPELGVTMKVFSGGQDALGQGKRRTGSVRHDHGDAADIFLYKDGRKLDHSNPDDQPLFTQVVQRARANGVTGIGAGDGYMLPGAMHIGFGKEAIWGADGKGSNAAPWLVAALQGVQAPPMQGNERVFDPSIQGSFSEQPTRPSFGPNVPAVADLPMDDPRNPLSNSNANNSTTSAFDFNEFMQQTGAAAPVNMGIEQPTYDAAIAAFMNAGGVAPTEEAKAPNAATARSAEISGAGVSPAQGSTPTAPGATLSTSGEEAPKSGPIERFMDTIYGTKDSDMSKDERLDRRRAVSLAMAAGFQSLSSGAEADYGKILGQRMELQQVRRGADALKKNAQGVSDMMVAAGFADRAQLPFMGQEGMNAALGMLGQIPSKGSAEFTLPNSYRATLAQTLSDSGQTELAEGIMTLNGQALETMYNGVIGQAVKPPSAEDADAVPRTPEELAAMAQIFTDQGDPQTAALLPFMDRDTQNKAMLERGKIAPSRQTASQIGTDSAILDQAVNADSAESLAAGFDSAGMPEEAAAARAANSYTEAKSVTDTMIERKAAATEAAITQQRGAAVAEFIPDSMPNAAELKAIALSAQTSEDLRPVYDAIAATQPTSDEKLIKLMQDNPDFMKSYTDLQLAKAGKDPREKMSDNFLIQEIQATTDAYIKGKASRAGIRRDMSIVRDIANDPDFESGILQANVAQPAQRVLNSLLGDAAPKVLGDDTMTGMKLVETFANVNFTALSAQLSGAISNVETERFIKSFPSTADSKTQMLAVAQYHIKMADIQDAEYAAMSEWLIRSENGDEAKGRNSMIDYINDRTKDMKVFQEVAGTTNEEIASSLRSGLMSGSYVSGEVLRVIDATGNPSYVVVP